MKRPERTRVRLPSSLPFEPYEAASGRPHVMVDGAARESSVLTLSHWPESPTPPALARDVSADIVLEYLEVASAWNSGGRLPGGLRSAGRAVAAAAAAECVTNDHFDEDGLMSVFALVDPRRALDHAEQIVDVASCGDFGVVRSEVAAQVSFAVMPMAAAEAGAGAGTSACYGAVLPLVPELLERPDRFERYWATEAEELAIGRSALAVGDVEIVEHRDCRLDLAVVTRLGPAAALSGRERAAGASGGLPIHAVAVHSATTASRILAFDGEWCELYLRYEGWVRFASRRVPLRPDLGPLALLLSAEEPSGVLWEANGVGAIVGRLRPGGDGRTEIAPHRVESVVADYLAHEPPAWDPWRAGGAYIPDSERAGYVSPRRSNRRR
jgi:hypothetical protein